MNTKEIVKEFHCSESTIHNLVKENILSPTMENGRRVFDRAQVLKALGLEYDPDEPFIMKEEVADMLSVSHRSVIACVRLRGIPCYSFKRGKRGSNYLFLRSDIEAYKKIKSDLDFGYLLEKHEITKKIVKIILSIPVSCNLTDYEKEALADSFTLKTRNYQSKYYQVTKQMQHLHIQSAFRKVIKNLNRLQDEESTACISSIVQACKNSNPDKAFDYIKHNYVITKQIHNERL